MTWKQFAEKYLSDNGMSENLAEAVVALAMEHNAFSFMKDRWNDAVEGYPSPVQAPFVMCLRKVVREWIEEHLPEAWFKETFQD